MLSSIFMELKSHYSSKKIAKVSCAGFVVLCDDHVLLVSTHKGVWGYPKGKCKRNEELLVCAYRELQEETGLTTDQIMPIQLDEFSIYEISDKGSPSVKLYLATTNSLIKPIVCDENELAEAKWVKIQDAYNLLTHKNRSEILRNCTQHVMLLENIKHINEKANEQYIKSCNMMINNK